MTDEILKAYKDVEKAVERYIKLLHDHVTMMQNVEPPGSDKVEGHDGQRGDLSVLCEICGLRHAGERRDDGRRDSGIGVFSRAK